MEFFSRENYLIPKESIYYVYYWNCGIYPLTSPLPILCCLCPADEDYNNTVPESIIFNPGSTEFIYTVTLRPDERFEGGDERLIIGLRATGAGGVVISQRQFTLTITEDDSRSHDTVVVSHDKHICTWLIMTQCFNNCFISWLILCKSSAQRLETLGLQAFIRLYYDCSCIPLILNAVFPIAVSVRLESAEISVSEGANLVSVNVMKEGQTTVNTRVILNTTQIGTAEGKSLFICSQFHFYPWIDNFGCFFQLVKIIF
jgi:hypothetical protein